MCFLQIDLDILEIALYILEIATLYVRNSPDMATDKEANRCLKLC